MPIDQDLRVDCTALFNSARQNYLIIININYSFLIVSDAELFRQALAKTSVYIVDMFGRSFPIHYQVNASYYLRHLETNDIRLFTGSFFLSGNRHASLSGPLFLNFDPASFIDSVLEVANIDRAKDTLTWTDSTSNWTFDSLHSVIISFQIARSKDHPFLHMHNLIAPRHSRRRRRHVVFIL